MTERVQDSPRLFEPPSCCGARQKLRLTKQACFLPTAATRFVKAQATRLHFPQAENSDCTLAFPLPTKQALQGPLFLIRPRRRSLRSPKGRGKFLFSVSTTLASPFVRGAQCAHWAERVKWTPQKCRKRSLRASAHTGVAISLTYTVIARSAATRQSPSFTQSLRGPTGRGNLLLKMGIPRFRFAPLGMTEGWVIARSAATRQSPS